MAQQIIFSGQGTLLPIECITPIVFEGTGELVADNSPRILICNTLVLEGTGELEGSASAICRPPSVRHICGATLEAVGELEAGNPTVTFLYFTVSVEDALIYNGMGELIPNCQVNFQASKCVLFDARGSLFPTPSGITCTITKVCTCPPVI